MGNCLSYQEKGARMGNALFKILGYGRVGNQYVLKKHIDTKNMKFMKLVMSHMIKYLNLYEAFKFKTMKL